MRSTQQSVPSNPLPKDIDLVSTVSEGVTAISKKVEGWNNTYSQLGLHVNKIYVKRDGTLLGFPKFSDPSEFLGDHGKTNKTTLSSVRIRYVPGASHRGPTRRKDRCPR